jgi:hypothetical protein
MKTHFQTRRISHTAHYVEQVDALTGEATLRGIYGTAPEAKRQAFASAASLSLCMHEPCVVVLNGERFIVIVTKQNV